MTLTEQTLLQTEIDVDAVIKHLVRFFRRLSVFKSLPEALN